MKAKEIRLKTPAELHKDLSALREKMRQLRFKLHSKEQKNLLELSAVKKDIAKILTIIKEMEIREASNVKNN